MSSPGDPIVDERERIESENGAVHLQYDAEIDGSLSMAVVKAVAAATNTDPAEMEPLYEALNPDALNRIYQPKENGERRKRGGNVTFWLEGCEITIYQNGDIVIGIPDEVLSQSETDAGDD